MAVVRVKLNIHVKITRQEKMSVSKCLEGKDNSKNRAFKE